MGHRLSPMLAAKVDEGTFDLLRFPLYASPKLDGVRAVVHKANGLVSRNFKTIPNAFVYDRFSSRQYHKLDGELVLGEPTAEDVFHKTQSAVMRREGTPDVKFYIFDNMEDVSAPWETRYRTIKNLRLPHCVVVEQVLIFDLPELLRYEMVCLKKGYEGVMLRTPHGTYKNGRSTLGEQFLVKLKRFDDGEAIIIGVSEEMHNTNVQERDALGRAKRSTKKDGLQGAGRLGSIHVRDVETKVEFDIGSGFDDNQRRYMWYEHGKGELIGKQIKYKYQKVGIKDKPRFPVFLGYRYDI